MLRYHPSTANKLARQQFHRGMAQSGLGYSARNREIVGSNPTVPKRIDSVVPVDTVGMPVEVALQVTETGPEG